MDGKATTPPPRLGIIISMFPELHETFILRELVALELRGVDFDIYSLQFPRDPITVDDAIRLSTEKTYYSALFNVRTLSAFIKTIVRHPIRVAAAIAKVIYLGRDRPKEVVKNLAILPSALHFGYTGWDRGVRHWHGHWSNIPTTACWYLQKIHGDSWSAAIHGEDIFSPNRFLRHKLDNASFTVVCSGYFCNHLKTQIGLDAPEDVHLNYHGLDPRVMNHFAERQFRQRSAEDFLSLISIGRLVPTKGHDVVIKACAKLVKEGQKLHLQLVGSGPDEQLLKELASKEGLTDHVTFTGALPFADVLDGLMKADLFCLAPRLIPGQPPDGIPNVIAEAMALRIPVVTTRVSAIPELVSDGETGRVVEVDDVDGFASAIASLANQPEEARRLSGAAALRVADLFNQSKNINELLALFDTYTPIALPVASTAVIPSG
ncbi:MAG: glycosyltransferase involved in cell wall biosynthesis [Halioglobus sp.]|jgi:glycosyltransferase involved in cell wall biosynthesis